MSVTAIKVTEQGKEGNLGRGKNLYKELCKVTEVKTHVLCSKKKKKNSKQIHLALADFEQLQQWQRVPNRG